MRKKNEENFEEKYFNPWLDITFFFSLYIPDEYLKTTLLRAWEELIFFFFYKNTNSINYKNKEALQFGQIFISNNVSTKTSYTTNSHEENKRKIGEICKRKIGEI